MIREIIFRAKCYGTWHYGSYVHLIKKPSNNCCNCNHKDFIVSNEDDGEHYYPITDLSSVGQFTGLTDCKGKEIFEGDMLDFTIFDVFGGDQQYRGVVRYCGSRFMIWQSLDGDGAFDLDWIIEQDDECEIIGNIYDNPEIIKR